MLFAESTAPGEEQLVAFFTNPAVDGLVGLLAPAEQSLAGSPALFDLSVPEELVPALAGLADVEDGQQASARAPFYRNSSVISILPALTININCVVPSRGSVRLTSIPLSISNFTMPILFRF